jgi:hypothetical protein
MNADVRSLPECHCPACLRLERAMARYGDGVARTGELRLPKGYAAVRRALKAADLAHVGTGKGVAGSSKLYTADALLVRDANASYVPATPKVILP